MAQLGSCRAIYICENNMYGGHFSERAMSLQDVASKACAYEMASESVDGLDVLKMREATQRAVKARSRGIAADLNRSAHLSIHGPLHV